MNSKRRKALKKAKMKQEKEQKKEERLSSKNKSSFKEMLKEDVRVIEDNSFEEKIYDLTSGFSLDLEDAMLMFSNKKGSKKFTAKEYERYQEMVKKILEKLYLSKGDYVKAYNYLLTGKSGFDPKSVEYRIIKSVLEKRIEKDKDVEER